MRRCNQNFTTSWASKLALFAILLTQVASNTNAAPVVGYQLRMASDIRLLLAPNNPNVRMLVSKKTKYDRMIERMMPYFEIENTSEEASLESWQFSIGQVDYNFEDLEILDEPFSGSSPSLAQSLLPLGTPSADLLSLNLQSLAPGQSVMGRITLAPDNPVIMEIPDYRNVLFQMDSPESPEVTNNATIDTVFSDGSTLSGVLPNFTHDGSMLGPSLIPCSNRSFFEQEVFQFGQSGESTVVVPEPGSLLLAILGLTCLIGRSVFRRVSRN